IELVLSSGHGTPSMSSRVSLAAGVVRGLENDGGAAFGRAHLGPMSGLQRVGYAAYGRRPLQRPGCCASPAATASPSVPSRGTRRRYRLGRLPALNLARERPEVRSVT